MYSPMFLFFHVVLTFIWIRFDLAVRDFGFRSRFIVDRIFSLPLVSLVVLEVRRRAGKAWDREVAKSP